jgi:hypothetical protein
MAVNLDMAARIKAISKPRETREEVIAYYQGRYTGQKADKNGKITYEWKTKIVDALQKNVVDKKGNEYKKGSLQRRFQTGRELAKKVQPHQVEEYKTLGKKLPRIPPSAIHIHGEICVRYSDNPCESRSFDQVLEGDELDYFLAQMDMQVLINKYMEIPVDQDEPTITECPCNGDDCQCDFEIEAIDEGVGESVIKKKKRTFKAGNKGATTKSKLPGLLQNMKDKQQRSKEQEPSTSGATVKRMSQAEIIAEMDAYQKGRGLE